MPPSPRDGRHILMVAPLYPAVAGPEAAAAMRSRGLALAFRELGHRVTVVCAMPKGVEPDRRGGVDVVPASWLDLESLARSRGMAAGTLVKPKLGSGPPRHTVLRSIVSRLLPDRYATWVPSAVRAIRRKLEPDTILFSTGPRSSHIAARLAVGKHVWIADLNDLWAQNPHLPRRIFRDIFEGQLERNTIGQAHQMTTVNDLMAEELANRYDTPVTTIFSGFNPADFEGRNHVATDGPVRIVFAGTVYRSVDFGALLGAVRDGKDEGWLSPEALSISFVGRLSERVEMEAQEQGVGDIVTARGLIPREALLDEVVAADALLLPLYELDPYALPMRFFEYVGSGRPIIGYGPGDRIPARLIREHGLGTVVTTRSDVHDLLKRIVADGQLLPEPPGEARNAFTWAQSTERLRELLTTVDA